MPKNLDIFLILFLKALLTVAMLWPLEVPPNAPNGGDKLIHFIAFVALVFPLGYTGRFEMLTLLIGASCFGGIVELIQPSFNRSADVNDWIADMLGVLIGVELDFIYRYISACGIILN